jgi:hypothetical protein
MLGEGTFGKVGMWELVDFANAAVNAGASQIAVKESRLNPQNPQAADLTNEGHCKSLG